MRAAAWASGLLLTALAVSVVFLLVCLVLAFASVSQPMETAQTFLAFSPDEKLLVGGGHRGEAQLWNTATPASKARRLSIRQSGKVYGETVRFLNEDTLVAVRDDGADPAALDVVYWNVATDTETKSLPLPYQAEQCRFSVSQTGHYLAVHDDDGTLEVWDLRAGEIAASHEHLGRFAWSVFSPDGRMFAFSDDGDVVIWDIQQDEIDSSVPIGAEDFALAPEGDSIATGVEGAFRVYDVKSGMEVVTNIEPTCFAIPQQFSQRGDRLLVDHLDATASTWVADKWVIWDVRSGKRVVELPVRGPALVVLSPSGELAAQYSNPNVTLWSEEVGESLRLRRSDGSSLPSAIQCVFGLLCLLPTLAMVGVTFLLLRGKWRRVRDVSME